MTDWFVTGTDTDVGKTVVTAAIAAAWRTRGHTPAAIKPLATGSAPPGDDAIQLGLAAGHEPAVHLCLPEPASPERAAIQAGRSIDMAAVVAWVRNHRGSPLLVEGVGGFAVPIDRHNTVADLAAQLGLPVLVVAANRLGVLNHTLLSIQAIRAANLTIAGLVLNNAASPPSALQQWNADDLRQRIGADIPIATIEQGTLPGDLVNMGESILSQLGH